MESMAFGAGAAPGMVDVGTCGAAVAEGTGVAADVGEGDGFETAVAGAEVGAGGAAAWHATSAITTIIARELATLARILPLL